MFALILTGIAWNWFEPIITNILNMAALKEKIIKDSIHGKRPYGNNVHIGKT